MDFAGLLSRWTGAPIGATPEEAFAYAFVNRKAVYDTGILGGSKKAKERARDMFLDNVLPRLEAEMGRALTPLEVVDAFKVGEDAWLKDQKKKAGKAAAVVAATVLTAGVLAPAAAAAGSAGVAGASGVAGAAKVAGIASTVAKVKTVVGVAGLAVATADKVKTALSGPAESEVPPAANDLRNESTNAALPLLGAAAALLLFK